MHLQKRHVVKKTAHKCVYVFHLIRIYISFHNVKATLPRLHTKTEKKINVNCLNIQTAASSTLQFNISCRFHPSPGALSPVAGICHS